MKLFESSANVSPKLTFFELDIKPIAGLLLPVAKDVIEGVRVQIVV